MKVDGGLQIGRMGEKRVKLVFPLELSVLKEESEARGCGL